MQVKKLLTVFAVSMAVTSTSAYAELISHDPYISPELVRSGAEKQQAPEPRDTAVSKVRGGAWCAGKKNGETCDDSLLIVKSPPRK